LERLTSIGVGKRDILRLLLDDGRNFIAEAADEKSKNHEEKPIRIFLNIQKRLGGRAQRRWLKSKLKPIVLVILLDVFDFWFYKTLLNVKGILFQQIEVKQQN
jgi:hypothetical protein